MIQLGKARGECRSLEIHALNHDPIFTSFMFIEFKSIDDANVALSTIHNHPFDAKHTFKINHFSDIERYASMDGTYLEPEIEEYTPRVRWLYDICIICHILQGTLTSMACRSSSSRPVCDLSRR